jgi:hypothetical protein
LGLFRPAISEINMHAANATRRRGGLVQTEAASEADFCSRAVLIAGVERSLNFSLARSQSCEKHTSEPVQLPIAIALLKSFSQGFRLVYCLKSF